MKKFDSLEIQPCKGFSREDVNVWINNFVSPRVSKKWTRFTDDHSFEKSDFNMRSSIRSDDENNAGRDERFTLSRASYRTLRKLKKKLTNLRNYYPELFYNKTNIIDLWAGLEVWPQVNMIVVESEDPIFWV